MPIKAGQIKWHRENPGKVRAHYLLCRERWLWQAAKLHARRAKLPFSISIGDVIIPRICPYLHIPLTHDLEHELPTNSTLSQIDPSLGYTKGNVQVVSDLANRMKQNATTAQLLLFAASVLALHGKESL